MGAGTAQNWGRDSYMPVWSWMWLETILKQLRLVTVVFVSVSFYMYGYLKWNCFLLLVGSAL